MLMVTTTVNVINRIHSNTSGLGPRVSLDTVLVEGPSSLQDGFINSSTAGNNTDHPPCTTRDDFLCTRREFQPCLSLINIVTNDNDIVARCSAQSTAVTHFLLDIGNNGSFRHGTEWENITDCQVCPFTGIDELACVHSLVGDEGFGAELIAVRIAEGDFGKGSASARVMDDFLDYSTKITMSFSVLSLTLNFWWMFTSRTRNFAAPFRRRVCDWKIPPDFLYDC